MGNGRVKKGERGYLDSEHRASLIRFLIPGAVTLLLGLCTWVIFPQYGMVFLVLAVISAIPTAMAAVNLIMFMRYKSCSEEDYKKIEEARGDVLIFYDSVMTTADKSYYIPCAAVMNKNVMLYSQIDKASMRDLMRHVSLMGKKNGFKEWHINVFDDIDGFVKRLKYLNEQNIKVLNTDKEMLKLISALSL